jgi:hypothetical protein
MKGYVNLNDEQRAAAKEEVAKAIKGIHDEIVRDVARDITITGLVDPENWDGTEEDIYTCYKMVKGAKRTETGITTEHGVVNSISPNNTHAGYVLNKCSQIIRDAGLWADGARGGNRKDDYFFWMCVCFEGEPILKMPFVINSPRITKLRSLYDLLCCPGLPIPDTWTI